MKLIIGKSIPSPKDQYKINFEWMCGDADSFEYVSRVCDDELECEFHYLMHKSVLGDRIEDRDKSYERKLIDEYVGKGCEFMLAEVKLDPNLESFQKAYWEETPHDEGGDCYACLEEIHITYFDENCVEHEVTIKD